jgi:hypothetical protein
MYFVKTGKMNGISMRISVAESRANGFKKWSDAQCPSALPRADDGPEMLRQAAGQTGAARVTEKAGK